ncbi:MAG TPA: hypothetical protein VH394_19735 [Thermoanaerobaculia bacterium]|jgi:hypothetical protein|nr:hypothetical protein [Thermoanaerobaculia bacterium]
MGDEPDISAIKLAIKFLVVVLLVVIVGFGLLNGVCGLELY